MKKYLYLALATFATIDLSSCSDGAFGGDYETDGVKLQEMCGTWCCTVEENDYYWTDCYYESEGYSMDFINENLGDPYGYYNPDRNNDGIVNLADLEIYNDEPGTWNDNVNDYSAVEFRTFNTASNNTTEMWLEDANFWGTQTKVNVDLSTFTFEAPGEVEATDITIQTGADSTSTANITSAYTAEGNDVTYGCGVVILGGKILKDAATAPGSGMVRDSIVFYIKYNDDYGPEIYYKVSGYMKTGYTEDD